MTQLIEHEPAVGRADADQALERTMGRRPHHIGMSRLADDPATGQDRNR